MLACGVEVRVVTGKVDESCCNNGEEKLKEGAAPRGQERIKQQIEGDRRSDATRKEGMTHCSASVSDA